MRLRDVPAAPCRGPVLPMRVAIEPAAEFAAWLAGAPRARRVPTRAARERRRPGGGHDIAMVDADAARVPSTCSSRPLRRSCACCRCAAVRALRRGARPARRIAVNGFHRRIALENLAHAFPECSAGRARAHRARRCSRTSAAAPRAAEVRPPHRTRRCSASSRSRARSACGRRTQQGKGVLFFTGHFGYWEMQGIAHPLRWRPIAVLARPLDNPRLHELLERIRTRTGNR